MSTDRGVPVNNQNRRQMNRPKWTCRSAYCEWMTTTPQRATIIETGRDSQTSSSRVPQVLRPVITVSSETTVAVHTSSLLKGFRVRLEFWLVSIFFVFTVSFVLFFCFIVVVLFRFGFFFSFVLQSIGDNFLNTQTVRTSVFHVIRYALLWDKKTFSVKRTGRRQHFGQTFHLATPVLWETLESSVVCHSDLVCFELASAVSSLALSTPACCVRRLSVWMCMVLIKGLPLLGKTRKERGALWWEKENSAASGGLCMLASSFWSKSERIWHFGRKNAPSEKGKAQGSRV